MPPNVTSPSGTTTGDTTKQYGFSANEQPTAASRLSTVARDTVHTMQNVLEEGKSAAKDLLHEGKVVAKERYDATTRRVEDATRENPLKALAIVAAVGFVFGILFGRR